ncbi:MAG: hypothetical protein HOY44_02150 [Maritimibacter sp.]|uniref:hypothetical protein n=1 Tax=Maritimibacter sp. TaxID=2003363 RepID=UPI001D1FF7D0|nr:hypothetical protein [Maritimibacter sp.]MBL6426309.1 hypothetical protein [Maritimibacter sp.]
MIFAEGLACESLYLGQETRKILDAGETDPRAQYPDLDTVRGIQHTKSARPFMDVGHARAYFGALDACEPA